MRLRDRIQHAWNAFTGQIATERSTWEYGNGNASPIHKVHKGFNTASFSAAIFNKIALDTSMTTIHHVKIDSENDDRKVITSGLDYCLNTEANIDQTHLQFMQDIVYSMFDEGSVAVVPVDTSVSPKVTGSYDINQMRVGKITQWFPQHVRVNLYNEKTGNHEEVTLPKSFVAIIENPLYAVVNGPNATLKRLLNKLRMLDDMDSLLASGRLDLLIQLPYAVKTDLQREQAEKRVKSIEDQLANNTHGIAYTDATEKVNQLSRPVNTTLLDDIELLTKQFYNQLGLTENVFNGTASEAEMRAYYTRTIDPILDNIIAEFTRKFLTKTARTQGQTLESYRDPFNLVPIEHISTMGDTMRRNGILTSNELRRLIGFKHHPAPEADELFNPNIADKNQGKHGRALTKDDFNTENSGSLTPPEPSSNE